MRQAECAGRGLNLLAQDLLVADRASLTAVRKHPIVVAGAHLPPERQQPLDIGFGKLNRTVRAVALGRVELAAVGRTHDPRK